MQQEVTSQHLRGATELTHISPIRRDLVPISETLTYGTRLKLLLDALMELRRTGVERYAEVPYLGPVDKLHMIHYVHWALVNHETELMLCVDFDGPWEPYVRRITDIAPSLLDLIWLHCQGYEDHLGMYGYAGFSEWARQYQVRTNFYFVADADVTVDDMKYLKEFRKLHERELVAQTGKPHHSLCPYAAASARLHVPPASAPTPTPSAADRKRALKIVWLLDRLRPFFPPVKLASSTGMHETPTQRDLFDTVLQDLVGDLRLSELRQELAGQPITQQPALPSTPRTLPVPDISLELGNIQGNIVSSYQRMNRGAVVLLRIDNAAAGITFLGRLAPHITNEQAGPTASSSLNIGITARGLQNLKLATELFSRLPKEFREGMAARAGLLGDVGRNHPGNWTPPVDLETIDLMVLLQSRDDHCAIDDHSWPAEHPLNRVLTDCLVDGVRILHTEPLRRRITGEGWVKEHFGFRDGISQPAPVAKGIAQTAPVATSDQVALGEILLGYANDRQELVTSPFLRNGSFLALRQLKQDVAGFKGFVEKPLGDDAPNGHLNVSNLPAKMMGRHYDGHSLAAESHSDATLNAFTYDRDPDGRRCPLQSHVRRANPRVTEVDRHGNPLRSPRIMRRGMSYGPLYSEAAQAEERGLMFLAFNASLADQYEIIQRWLNGGNSTGVLSSHRDPLVGTVETDTVPFTYIDEHHAVSLNTPLFVEVRWGAYFFFPSIDTLHKMGSYCGTSSATAAFLALGNQLLKGLQKLDAEAGDDATKRAAAALEWKKALEDRGTQKGQAQALWAAIRANGGFVQSSYGTLVGTAKGTLQVLGDESQFSVRRYWERMDQTLGGHYLGLDYCPVAKQAKDYTAESKELNPFIAKISRRAGYAVARNVAARVLASLNVHQPDDPQQPLIDLLKFSSIVVGKLSEYWFGLPDGKYMQIGPDDGPRSPNGPISYFPGDYRNTSLYLFFPNPEAWTKERAIESGKAINQAATQVLKSRASTPTAAQDLVTFLLAANAGAPLTDETLSNMARNLAGTVSGFVVATIGSLITISASWLTDGSFFRLQQQLAEGGPGGDTSWRDRVLGGSATEDDLGDSNWLMAQLIGTLKQAPTPNLLHRESVKEVNLSQLCGGDAGDQVLPEKSRVIISLGSAAADAATPSPDILFGGHNSTGQWHACPGKDMALGAMFGVLSLLLECRNVEAVGTTAIRVQNKPAPAKT